MRISNRNQYMGHIRNMQKTLSNLTNSNNRMSSQRAFDHAYENVADATKAMRLRKSIRDKDFYTTNIRDTRGRVDCADEALQTSVSVLRNVQDGLTRALNGTCSDEDRKIIAGEVENLQKEVLALMNSSYTDHFVFDAAGGPNKGEPPFTIGEALIPQMTDGTSAYYKVRDGVELFDADGKKITESYRTSEMQVPLTVYTTNPKEDATATGIDLLADADFQTYFEGTPVANVQVQKMEYTYDNVDPTKVVSERPADPERGQTTLLYHGMPVDAMKYQVVDGKTTSNIEWYNYDPKTGMVRNDPVTGSPYNIPYNETNYVDIGLGHKMMNTPDGQKINPETVMQFTNSGIEVFGLGMSDNGLPNNLYSFMGEVHKALDTNDVSSMNQLLGHLPDVRSTLLVSLTEIGVRSTFLDDMESIHSKDKLNYQSRQTDIEAVDLAEESMYNKNHEMAWMVTLQMGSKVLPTSLFDFMR